VRSSASPPRKPEIRSQKTEQFEQGLLEAIRISPPFDKLRVRKSIKPLILTLPSLVKLGMEESITFLILSVSKDESAWLLTSDFRVRR
jgi:hypothetical protein